MAAVPTKPPTRTRIIGVGEDELRARYNPIRMIHKLLLVPDHESLIPTSTLQMKVTHFLPDNEPPRRLALQTSLQFTLRLLRNHRFDAFP